MASRRGGNSDGPTHSATAPLWRPLSSSSEAGSPPAARCGHCAALLHDGRHMVVFGGYRLSGLSPTYYADLWLLDTESGEWKVLEPLSSQRPSARAHSAMVATSATTVVMVGGYNAPECGNFAYLTDMWRFDLGTLAWTKLPSEGNPPLGRFGSSLLLDPAGGEGSLLAVGGYFSLDGDHGYYSTVRRYDAGSGEWVEIPAAEGETPLGRSGHSATRVADNAVLVFGGYNDDTPGGAAFKYHNDVWMLTVVDGQSHWRRVHPGGNGEESGAPPGRNWHGAVATADGSALIVCGGMGREVFFDDMWKFDIASGTWTAGSPVAGAAAPPSPPPAVDDDACGGSAAGGSSSSASAVIHYTARSQATVFRLADDRLVAFGGYGADAFGKPVYLNDTLIVPLASVSFEGAAAAAAPSGVAAV